MKKTMMLMTAALAVMLILSAPAAAAGKNDVLVGMINHAPRHFNGTVQSGIATMFCASQLFATPLMFDSDWNPQPYLAKSWKISDDGLSVTLKLREDAVFHDGKPITSEDVAFSIMTIKANHPFKTMMGAVEKVDTPDPHTAVLRLSQPHPAVLLALSQPLCSIIPKHVFGDGQDLKTHPMNLKPVGSGPFKFVEYKPGEHVVMEAHEDFFLGAPKIKKFVLKIIKDGVNRLTSMEQNEVQLDVYVAAPTDIKRYEKIKHLVVEPMGPAVGNIIWLAFNTRKPPLDNVKVRQAIAYAFDRNFIIKRLHHSFSRPATGPIVPASPYYSADVEAYNLDLEKAAKLLDEAGYAPKADGVRFSVECTWIPTAPELMRIPSEYIAAQLKKIGVAVKLRASPDFPSWARRVASWDFDMTIDSVWNWGDPVIGVHRTYLSSNIRKGVIWSNTQGYTNPKVDQLLAKASKELDLAKRKALYAEFQKIVVADAPQAYIHAGPFHMAYNKKLKNLNQTIWGSMSPMYNVYFEE